MCWCAVKKLLTHSLLHDFLTLNSIFPTSVVKTRDMLLPNVSSPQPTETAVPHCARKKQGRRYQGKWPGWNIHHPGSSPAYCFASVIVWRENTNFTISDRFVLFWRWNGIGGLCVLRATKKGRQLFLRKNFTSHLFLDPDSGIFQCILKRSKTENLPVNRLKFPENWSDLSENFIRDSSLG